jgi:DNA-3-methyladenine glycosylase I
MTTSRRGAASKRHNGSEDDRQPKKPKKLSKISKNDTTSDPWYRTMFTRGDEEYDRYMSTEWGFEKRGDVPLFEKMSLEGAQSGLSWLTILRKRDAYRKTFHNFDIDKVAAMTSKDIEKILATTAEDPRDMVVRHRGKIEAVINNAKCIQALRKETKNKNDEDACFDKLVWSFVDDKPIVMNWSGNISEAYTKIPQSEIMSKTLKKKGFKFVGPTTMYAMMQSVGMVIDHPRDSPEYEEAMQRLKKRPGGYQLYKKG